MAPQRSVTRSGSLPSMSELDECSPNGEAVEEREDTIQVYIRVRPFSKRETESSQAGSDAPIALVEQDRRSVVVQAAPPRRFRFDGVCAEDSCQGDVFDLAGRGIADGFLDGFNGTVCVYGQTGAGKTYTMVGNVASVEEMHSDPRRGLICRTLDYVFSEIQKREAAMPEVRYAFRCSFLEIYREQITDLLESSMATLQLREDKSGGVYVDKLSEPAVASREEAYEVLLQGLQQRRTGTTQMNERSSRSHAVFTITMEMTQVRNGISSRQITRLNLVDLAGSERQMGVADLLRSNQLPGQGVPVKEACAINRSLSALTNVIMNLSREEVLRRKSSGNARGWACRRNFVNYRDSKLTFLLKDSLGGNSKTAIVANISPSALCSSETLSSLKFAARAKHIQCSAVRKEEFSASVEDLMREVTTLRRRVLELESGQDSKMCAVSTGSSCSRSSCRSSCSTEEDSLVASMVRGAKQEVELQARLSETKRDLFKAISQLAQVEAKLQLATAETNDLSHEAAKLQAARSNSSSLQGTQLLQSVRSQGGQPTITIPSGIASMPGCVPVTAEAYMKSIHSVDTSPKAPSQPQSPTGPHSPSNYGMEPVSAAASPHSAAASPRVMWPTRASPRRASPQPVQTARTTTTVQQRPQLPAKTVQGHAPPAQTSPRTQTPKSAQWTKAGTVSTVSLHSARTQVAPTLKGVVTRPAQHGGARDVTSIPQAVAA